MSSHYVYVIVNKRNLKLYFGSHSWDGEGLDPNYYGSGKIIKQAVNKYGKDNFIVYPIKFYDTVEECRKAEEELLKKYDVANNPYCYNIKNGAIGWTSEDLKGKPLSEETRKKLSQAHKGKTLSEEHRLKIAQAHKGRKFSEETKKKLSQARKGEKHPLYGKHHTEEHRQKISQALKGENNPMYGKRGKASPLYGKHRTEETRQKVSQAKNDKKIPVVAIQKGTGKIRVFESQMECARQLNLDKRNIYNCLKGRHKTCKGYIIKYLEQLESGIYEGITEGIAE